MISFGMMILNGSGISGKLLGYFISKYLVGVTNENVAQKYHILQYIVIASHCCEYLIVPLIPIKSEIEEIIVKSKSKVMEEKTSENNQI
jgi:hypothetical protein